MKSLFVLIIIFFLSSGHLFSSYFQDGLSYVEVKNYSHAATLFEKALKSNEKNQEKHLIHYYLGLCYNKLEKYDQSIDHYEKAIKIKPTWHLPYHNLALILYEKKNDRSRAKEYFQKSIALYPNFDIAYLNLGNLYLKEKDYNNAVKLYKNGLQYSKEDNLISVFYNGLGNAYEGLEQYSDSIYSFKKSIEHDPDNWKSYMNLGLVHFKQDLYDEAIDDLSNVIDIKKDYVPAYFYLANCYRGKKDFNKMEETYLYILSLDPGHIDTLYGLSSYYALKERKVEMLKILKTLFFVDKTYKNIILNEKLFQQYKDDKDFKSLF
ncbi:MAG: tetratricopeptide repeat protein [Spirochaetes bacterium]|nr:tetratricopeptide repeat protein [Spirochaetota bacterium]